MRLHDSSVRGGAVKYSNPPVVETVLSVQFKPLANFGAGQLGAYWKRLGSEWPHVTDAPAVEPVFEQFESAKAWEPSSFGLKLSQKIDIRLQIRNQVRNRMIQIQNGRFFYNWLGAPDTAYPSYDTVRPEFDEHWDKFREFVISECEENSVQPNQWELLYVNHMPYDTVWKELSEMPQVLTFLRQPELADMQLVPDGIGGEWRFIIGSKKGRLYVRLGTKMDRENNAPCVVMTLTARGPIAKESSSLHEGLELGHNTIVDAFSRITSDEAHIFWGIQNANE